MSTPQISLLAGLVKGYADEKGRAAKEELEGRLSSQRYMMNYLGHLAASPNVPPEHQQWALGKINELSQADPAKKLPKIDLGELPPVSVQQPAHQAAPQLPGMTLQPPVGPGTGGSAPASPAAPPSASGDVGRASNGTVNALGSVQQPIAPNFSVAPSQQSLTLPSQQQGIVQNPVPPRQLSPGGQPHVLTPSDRLAYQQAAQGEQMNALQQQYPGKSPEELAYFAQHGEFPKPQLHSVAPGSELVDEKGKVVARNETRKPGQKSGYSYERGPGGEVLVKDNETGATLSKQEIEQNPDAKAVYSTAKSELAEAEKRQDERDTQKFVRAQELAAQHEEASRKRQVTAQAVDAAKKAKPMVDVLDTSEQYMASGKFTPREDLALIVRAVRAMNPGSVRLPQKELELELKAGSYGDRFSRWYSTASKGTLPDDQRQDLMSVIRDETTQTAKSAAENWRTSFEGTKESEPPSYLRRFEHKDGAGGTGPGQFSVTDPDGGVHTFPDKASADRFKALVDRHKGGAR